MGMPKIEASYEKDFGLGSGPGKDGEAGWARDSDFKGKHFRHSGYVYVRYGK